MSGKQSDSSNKQVDPRETLNKLRNEHLEKVKALSELKERQYELQNQILTAQDAVFKSYQTFAGASEQFLVNVINEQNNQLKTVQSVSQSNNTNHRLPTVTEVREDNL